jgi:hypothetical protein
MTNTKKIFIGAGLLISTVGMAFLLSSCLVPTVSRVPVPGSSMTAVVTADLEGCYDVELYEQGHPIPGQRQCLGPYASQHCSLAQVSTTSNIVTITWTDGGSNGYHYSTAVDVDARRFVVYSNGVPVR